MIQEIKTVAEFKAVSNLSGVRVIHFWAEWNGTDVLMKQILCEVEDEIKDVEFYSIDVDVKSLSEICRSIPILNVPILLYLKNGERKFIDVGFNGKEIEETKEKVILKLSDLVGA